MAGVFDKMKLKDETEILVLNAPASFEPELARLRGVTVHRSPADVKGVAFALAFVTTPSEVETASRAVAKKTKGDALVWFAYPKGTSKKYRSEINRDAGWDALGKAGFEGVAMVAIDEDWAAKRVRRREFIKRQ
jgi:hypothetical protein